MENRLEIPVHLKRKMVEIARHFRKQRTKGENVLWQALRRKQLNGVKFRRQQPIGPFVVDFFAAEHRLVVEVDGPIHNSQVAADRERQSLLEASGLRFVRLSSLEVERRLETALLKIRGALGPLPRPLSHTGRGEVVRPAVRG